MPCALAVKLRGKPPKLVRLILCSRSNSIPISWGSIDRNFVNLTIPAILVGKELWLIAGTRKVVTTKITAIDVVTQ